MNQGFLNIQDNKYKVYVYTCTYNQSQYIEDCLYGVANQKTTFPFIYHIIDDASTDGEQDIIKKWVNKNCNIDTVEYYDNDICSIINITHKTNLNCRVIIYFLKKNLYETDEKRELIDEIREKCKYEALCEGDDYWIDSLKLQKQIDFLDNNKEYIMCCTDANMYDVKKDEYISCTRYNKDSDISAEKMIIKGGPYVQTATLVFRTSLYDNYPKIFRECYNSDAALQIYATLNGKVRYLVDKTAVYRLHAPLSVGDGFYHLDINTLLKKFKQYIDFFNRLDEYSNYTYHKIIMRRRVNYCDKVIKNYPDYKDKIIKLYCDLCSKNKI